MKLDLIRQQQRFNEAKFCVDGRLYLFEDSQVTVLEAWPKLRAWRRLAGGKRFERTDPTVMIHGFGSTLDWLKQWEVPHEPFSTESTKIWHASQYNETEKSYEFTYFRIGLTSDDPEAILASERYKDFIETIPQAVLSRITRFTYGQWRLAGLCSRIPEFLTLIDSHPALAFALVHAERFRDQPTPTQASFRNKIRLAPEKLAAWLGFPESPATVEILQKILPSACNVEWLLRLRQKYFAPVAAVLRGVVLIDQMTLAFLVGRNRQLVTDEFIVEFAQLAKDERRAAFARFEFTENVFELDDYLQFTSIAELIASEFALTARYLLHHGDGDGDWREQHLANYLPEAPDFLTLLEDADAPAFRMFRRYQFAGTELVLRVSADRVDFRGTGPDFSGLSKCQRSALVAWLEVALRRLDADKIK